MDKQFKFVLPSPSFDKNPKQTVKAKPHFLTPSGMTLLPREKQPPPMYGKMGATVPAKYLNPKPVEDHIVPPAKQYCEPCELELQSMEDYKRHRAQHEKCPVAGCQYNGHPTVMDKHINALHSTGLFDKVKKLNSPEEIAAWREERRKKYPTVANVLLKQKAQEQRQKRGERLGAKRNRFGNVEDRKRAQPNQKDVPNNEDGKSFENNSRNKHQRNNNRNKRNQKGRGNKRDVNKPTNNGNIAQPEQLPKDNTEETPWHGLDPFQGTLQMNDYKHVNRKPQAKTENLLFGLVGMYGSDIESESEDEQDEENEEISQVGTITMKEESENILSETKKDDTQNLMVGDEIQSAVAGEEEKIESDIYSKEETVNEEGNISPIAENSSKETPEQNCPLNTLGPTSCVPSESTISCQINSENKSNESDEAPEEVAIQRSIPEFKQESSSTNLTASNTHDTTKKQVQKKPQSRESTKAKQQLKRRSGLDYRKLKMRKQNTMLEKLLEPDIRHERNVLLQCVRYVCENNFFEVGRKPTGSD